MAKSFSDYSGIQDPQNITGSLPTKQSGAGVLGDALGGIAQILDVGLKASSEARESRVAGSVEDALTATTREFQGQTGTIAPPQGGTPSTEPGNVFDIQESGLSPEALRDMDKLRQGNAQGRVSRAEFFAKTSAIVQQAIHDNPRFADAIRKRAQETLGLNPTASAIALEVEGQKSAEEMQRAAQGALLQEGIKRGMGRMIEAGPDAGTFDVAGSISDIQHVLNAELQLKNSSEILDNQLKALQVEKAKQGKDVSLPEQHDLEERMLMQGPHRNDGADSVYDTMVRSKLTGINELVKQNPNLNVDEQTALLMGQVNQSKTEFMGWLDAQMDSSNLSAESKEKLRKNYNDKFTFYSDATSGGFSSFQTMINLRKGFEERVQGDARRVAPGIMAGKVILGDTTFNTVFGLALARQEGTPARTAIDGQAITMFDYLMYGTNIAGGKPSSQGKPITLKDVPTEAQKGTVQVLGDTIDTIVQHAIDGSMKPEELPLFGNSLESLSQAAADSNNVDNLRGAAKWSASPSVIATVEKLAVVNPTQASTIAKNLMKANANQVSLAGQGMAADVQQAQANASFQTRDTNRTPVQFNPAYNPETGSFEVETKGLGQFNVMAPLPPIPATVVKRIQDMNTALEANVRLKHFGTDQDKKLTDAQYKQAAADLTGLPMKSGIQRVKLPGEEKPAPGGGIPVPGEKVKGTPGIMIDQFSTELKLRPEYGHALIQSESGGKPDVPTSETGNIGIAQMGEAAAKDMGVDRNIMSQNLFGGLKYFKTQLDLYHGDVEKAAIAYKAGPDNVEAYIENPNKFPMVQAGVKNFLGHLGLEPHYVAPVTLRVKD